MARKLFGKWAVRPTLCQSITATTTGAAVDTGNGSDVAFLVVTDGSLACSGTNKWTLKLEHSADGTTYNDVDDSQLTGDGLVSTATRAVATLTMAGVGADGETFTLGGRTYELDDDGSVTAGNVSVDVSGGAAAADVCAAAIIAVNADTQADCTAAAGAGTTVVFTANTTNATVGNALASTETMTNGSFGAATFAGGVSAVTFGLETNGTIVLDEAIPATGVRGILNYVGGGTHGSRRYFRATMTKAASAPNIVMAATVLFSTQNLPPTQ